MKRAAKGIMEKIKTVYRQTHFGSLDFQGSMHVIVQISHFGSLTVFSMIAQVLNDAQYLAARHVDNPRLPMKNNIRKEHSNRDLENLWWC